ncbi:MAG: regulatory iron-sulfur-containing complex subunit RicT [Nitrospirota bacterium]|nr:regulatory iron-sulfur-containing complex subunit RicT [Nitrospirota bacterium]
MPEIVGVKFRNGCKIYDFDANTLDLAPGDTVIVDTENGLGYARVATEKRPADGEQSRRSFKKVVRRTTDDDMKQLERNLAQEERALRICQSRIAERDIPMKLVGTEITFDGNKTTFLYTADGRVDFRDLVKEMASHLHTRIEMRQIGVRDEARVIGGYGPCGQQLCCTTFITEFEPVSIKMAKEQGLALNPAKISGVCGRLMCCLAFEYEGGGCGSGGGHGGGSCGHGGHGSGHGGGQPCHTPQAAPQAQAPQKGQEGAGREGREEGEGKSKRRWWKRKKKKKGGGETGNA